MKRKELIAENERLKGVVDNLREQLTLGVIKEFKSGIRLTDDPFIPEYLGFTETIHRNKEDLLEARIYTKDGFNIAKHIDTELKTWVIMKPSGEKYNLLIDNMLDAIAILRGCGMNVSLQDYFDQNIAEANSMDLRESKLEKELKELSKEIE